MEAACELEKAARPRACKRLTHCLSLFSLILFSALLLAVLALLFRFHVVFFRFEGLLRHGEILSPEKIAVAADDDDCDLSALNEARCVLSR